MEPSLFIYVIELSSQNEFLSGLQSLKYLLLGTFRTAFALDREVLFYLYTIHI